MLEAIAAFLTRQQPGATAASHATGIDQLLRVVRTSFEMDVILVAENIGQDRVLRHVDVASDWTPMRAGDVFPLEFGFCDKICRGVLPQVIPDTSLLPEAQEILAESTLPIGAHMGVPLYKADGSLFGTFCCFSFAPRPSLGARELAKFQAMAEVISFALAGGREKLGAEAQKLERIRAVLVSSEPRIVYQPVFSADKLQIIGAEALSRFGGEPVRSPDLWFKEAGEVGLKVELEKKAIRAALTGFHGVWARGPFSLAVNSSPQTIMSPGFAELFDGLPANRITLEITEEDHIDNYEPVLKALAPLRLRGIRIAVDDAGAGYASLRHILNIKPDAIKLDVSITRTIDSDQTRRALARAMVAFGRETGCKIVAEGVETSAELETLQSLGADAAQGYHLSRPVTVEALLDLLPSPVQTGGRELSTQGSKLNLGTWIAPAAAGLLVPV